MIASTYYLVQGSVLTYDVMPVENLEGEVRAFTWYDENGDVVLDDTHTQITVNGNIDLYSYIPNPPEE